MGLKVKWKIPKETSSCSHIIYIYKILIICICIRTWMSLVVACCFVACCCWCCGCCLFLPIHPYDGKHVGLLPSLRETHEGNAVVVVPFFLVYLELQRQQTGRFLYPHVHFSLELIGLIVIDALFPAKSRACPWSSQLNSLLSCNRLHYFSSKL